MTPTKGYSSALRKNFLPPRVRGSHNLYVLTIRAGTGYTGCHSVFRAALDICMSFLFPSTLICGRLFPFIEKLVHNALLTLALIWRTLKVVFRYNVGPYVIKCGNHHKTSRFLNTSYSFQTFLDISWSFWFNRTNRINHRLHETTKV